MPKLKSSPAATAQRKKYKSENKHSKNTIAKLKKLVAKHPNNKPLVAKLERYLAKPVPYTRNRKSAGHTCKGLYKQLGFVNNKPGDNMKKLGMHHFHGGEYNFSGEIIPLRHGKSIGEQLVELGYKKEMDDNIKRLLDRAWKAYDDGKPFMSDADFDALSIKYNYNEFGSMPLGEKATHPYQMNSLKKVYDEEPAPYPIKNPIKSPKLDGTAISLVYEHGFLSMALRRGRSGETEGQVVTDKVSLLVPNTVEFKRKHQIDGEVVCDKSINNARNYASGAFGLKDIEEFKTRVPHLKFVAYGVRPVFASHYTTDMALLHSEGITTVLGVNPKEYRTDGRVFRENDNKLYEAAGYTSKHPRGAYARKKSSEVAIKHTTLQDVQWQVGRTGQITPVALFDEVIIDDAKITKATLHNAGFIEEMELDIGDTIIVTRSGGIIPKVLGKV